MSRGANSVHLNLRHALEDYIKAQYFGKSPVLLSALQGRFDQEGVLYKKPYIESSPAYKTELNGIQKSKELSAWLKDYFTKLAAAKLGVFSSPFCHQVSALEAAVAGQDIFVSTGTGSGKTECFMWPLMAKLAMEAKESPETWSQRGVRVMIMYPMNALVSDQISRLRRLLGDREHKFVNIFRQTCGMMSRRPQFGMYTGRTPYAGRQPDTTQDRKLEKTYSKMMKPTTPDEQLFLEQLISDGRLPAKENFDAFLEKLHSGLHIPDDEDAELVTRFEMQNVCPDILITNYSMLEFMLIRPRESSIWQNTRKWLEADPANKLLFVIDEAHMYRGSAGGEVSLLIRRLFHHLGIDRSRVQFILTTASMPNRTEEDRLSVQVFANDLTASNKQCEFRYLIGEREKLKSEGGIEIPFAKFMAVKPEDFETDDVSRLAALNAFWNDLPSATATFTSCEEVYHWMYHRLTDYVPFCILFRECRGSAVALHELAKTIFPNEPEAAANHAINVMLSIAPLAKSVAGNVLFPARMHMLFRGIKGVYACANPNCSHAHTDGEITLGEVYFSEGVFLCKECGGAVYELYNDRRCGSLFFKGYVLTTDFEQKKRAYLWCQPGLLNETLMREIHLFIPPEGYKVPIRQNASPYSPCYLDVVSGFINFEDDSWNGRTNVRKLYYSTTSVKSHPDILTFSTCPHCRHQLSKAQLMSFNTRGNQAFYNLIKAQFEVQPPVSGKTDDPDRLPNQGRKVLLFSDSRQRAAKLARDMSDSSDMNATRQLAALAISRMEMEPCEQSLNVLYDFFAMAAKERHVHLFVEDQQVKLLEDGAYALSKYDRSKRRNRPYTPRFTIDNAPNQMKEQVLRLYCGGYNTFIDTAVSWLEPTDMALDDAICTLEESGVQVTDREFIEVFNAWMMWVCDSFVALGHTILDASRYKVRQNFNGYGLPLDWEFPSVLKEIMGWQKNDPIATTWQRVLTDSFLDNGQTEAGRYYVDLSRVKPRYGVEHVWYRCEQCSELTPYLIKGACPSCACKRTHPMKSNEIDALDFWRKPIEEAMKGGCIRIIDTEEHTAQLSHKDQRDDLWSKTEQYELRFQDFIQGGQSPVDILSSTTTMEVGIDIGSLVAVGLRNIPPMRENYQQRAGRAGRRGSNLSTIVTFCEDGPHDSMYFAHPIPMFRGDPRRPWVDISSEKISQRHLAMIVLRDYLSKVTTSLDVIAAADFLNDHLARFIDFLTEYTIVDADVLLPTVARRVLSTYKDALKTGVTQLKFKYDTHPELFESPDLDGGKKSLLDALYEEGIIPTYSFPKNVVSTYVNGFDGKIKYQVERGLDIAINEYAPGRAIVIDKTTYQIGGLYYPGRDKHPATATTVASSFINDPNYLKLVLTCPECGWFGLQEDQVTSCPFCNSGKLKAMLPMLKPWGFAPKNGRSIETAQLTEEYSPIQRPLYSTLPNTDDLIVVDDYANLRVATRSNQRIIMLNRGTRDKGFMVCRNCGAAIPGEDGAALNRVYRPYFSKFAKTHCRHDPVNVNLGYDFVTDMLVFEIKLDTQQIDVSLEKSSWLNRAGQSLAEALRLAACQELDIEFTELVTGYRIRQNNDGCFIDVYLYDSLSSGAGYAVRLTSLMKMLLEKTKHLLSDCTCEMACYECLKNFRNQYVHNLLDRKAALDLLSWSKYNARATSLSSAYQIKLAQPLSGILQWSGVTMSINGTTISVSNGSVSKSLVIYPSMWVLPSQRNTIFVSEAQMKIAKPLAVKTICTGLDE